MWWLLVLWLAHTAAASPAGTVPPQRQPTPNLRLSAGESVTVYRRVRTIGILRLTQDAGGGVGSTWPSFTGSVAPGLYAVRTVPCCSPRR